MSLNGQVNHGLGIFEWQELLSKETSKKGEKKSNKSEKKLESWLNTPDGTSGKSRTTKQLVDSRPCLEAPFDLWEKRLRTKRSIHRKLEVARPNPA